MKAQFLPLAAAWIFSLISPHGEAAPDAIGRADGPRDSRRCRLADEFGICMGNLEAQTVTFALGSADSVTGSALATGLSTASASSLLSPAAATSKSAAIARAP